MAPRWPGGSSKGPAPKQLKGTKELHSVRDVALQRRKRLLFGKFAESQAGTTQLFPLFTTFPWHIQKHSSFLALHFTTIGLFWILLLLYCLLALYPLISTLRVDNYQTNFELRGVNGTRLSGRCAHVNQAQDRCPLLVSTGARVQPKTPILQMSVGNFCADNGFSAVEDCGSVCTTKATSCPSEDAPMTIVSNQSVCNDLAMGNAKAANQCCWSSFERDPDGSVSTAEEIPHGHFWLWAVAGTVLYCLWLIGVQQFQTVTQRAVQRKNITAADYAVFVSNLNGTLGDDSKLEDFGRHYGEVVMAFHIRTLGRVLQKCNNIRDLGDKRKELRGLQLAAQERADARSAADKNVVSRFNRWVYARYMCLWRSPEGAYQRAQEKWKRLRSEESALEEQELEPTGNAIIVFNDEESAQNMLWDYQRRLSSSVLSKVFTPGLMRAFHVLTGGMFSATTRIQLDLPGRTAERFVTLRRAPEPSDIWWENTRDYAGGIVRRRTIAVLGYIGLLVLAFGVQFALGLQAEAERIKRIEGSSSAGKINTEFLIEQVRNRVFLAGKALSTFMFSSLGSVLIQSTSNYELHTTSTANVGATVTKLSIFNLMNYFIVPIVAVIALAGSANDDQESVWYRRGGFVETAFWIQLGNAFLPSIASVVGMPRMLRLHSLSRAAVTQTYADKWTDPQPFSMAYRLALGILTVGLSLLYAPILPISPFIGLVGITVHYAADQYVALRHSLKPRAFDVEALDAVNYVLRLLPLAQVLLMLLYFPGTKKPEPETSGETGFDRDKPVFAPVVVGVIVWLIFAMLPAHLLTRLLQHKHEQKHRSRAKRPKFLRLVRAMQLQPTAADHHMTTTLAVVRDVPDKSRFVPDDYVPKLTTFSSQKWYNKVQQYMHLIDPPKPALEEKLRNQSDATQVLPGGRVRNAAEQSRTKRLGGGGYDSEQRIVQLDAGKGVSFTVDKNEDNLADAFAPAQQGEDGEEGRPDYHTKTLYTLTFDEPSNGGAGGGGAPAPRNGSPYRPGGQPVSGGGDGVLQAVMSGDAKAGGMLFGNQQRLDPFADRQGSGWDHVASAADNQREGPDSFDVGLPGRLPNVAAQPRTTPGAAAPYVLPGRSAAPTLPNGEADASKPYPLPGKSTAPAKPNGVAADKLGAALFGKSVAPPSQQPFAAQPSKHGSFTPSHAPGYLAQSPASGGGGAIVRVASSGAAAQSGAGVPYVLPGRSAVPAAAAPQAERQPSSGAASLSQHGRDAHAPAAERQASATPSIRQGREAAHRSTSSGGAGAGTRAARHQRFGSGSGSDRPDAAAVAGYVLPGRSSEPSVDRSRDAGPVRHARQKSQAEEEEAEFAALMKSVSTEPQPAGAPQAAERPAMDESAELRLLMGSLKDGGKRV